MSVLARKFWILESPPLDMLLIILPGWLGVLLAWNLPQDSLWMTLYAMFAIWFVDAGHTYTTWWRTIFRKQERETHYIYWLAPVATVVGIFLWIKFRLPYLWSFIAYNAIFHQIRQYYGVSRWYQKLNGRFCRISNRFLYTLLVMPFVLFHFRGIDWIYMYSEDGGELFLYPSAVLFRAGLVIYFVTLAGWLAFEARLWAQGIREPNRFLSMLVPISIYGIGFILGNSIAQVIFPILMAHGIPYMAIMDVSLRRLNPAIFTNFLKVLCLMIFTAALLSSVESYASNFLETLNQAYRYRETSTGQAFLTALVMTPLICHFIWDAYIWKGTHREAKTVYALSEKSG